MKKFLSILLTVILLTSLCALGSVIRIADGYQYRLEGWQTLGAVNSEPRCGNSTSGMTVDTVLYAKYSYIGFNISKTAGGAVSSADTDAFRIYVPVSNI